MDTSPDSFTQRFFGDGLSQLKQHPGLILSIGYLVWAFIGVFYLVIYYDAFDIPILKLLEISDILVAGLQEPQATISFIGALLLIAFIIVSTQWSEDFRNRRHDLFEKWYGFVFKFFMWVPRKRMNLFRLFIVVSLVLYFSLFLEVILGVRIESIKNGQTDLFSIQQNGEMLRPNCNKATAHDRQILGSTTKFLIIYSSECRSSKVITIENIEQIEASKSRR